MRNIPRYAANPLQRFREYVTDSTQLLRLSIMGIHMLIEIPDTLRFIEQHEPPRDPPEDPAEHQEKFQQQLRLAEEAAQFAKRECKSGFPLLHAHTVVGLWSAFVSAIEDAVAGMLMNEPDLLQLEIFSKVRIPLADFEALEKQERMRVLVQEIEKNNNLVRRQGVDGFEALFAHVNLSGAVDPEVKKSIWELSHVRNVIVHRGSVADRRLVQSCPWMGLKVGDHVTVTKEALGRYFDALGEYLLTILRRLCIKYEVDYEERLRIAGITTSHHPAPQKAAESASESSSADTPPESHRG